MQDYEISVRGETVVYEGGSEPLLIMASGKRAEIPSTSQVRFPVFDKVILRNTGAIEAVFTVFIVEGEFRSLAEGSKLISYIENTSEITTPIVGKLESLPEHISTPIVSKIAELKTLTHKTSVMNPSEISSPIVSKITELLSSTLNVKVNTPSLVYSPIVSKITTLINSILKTQEQCATSLKESIHSFSVGLSHSIEANTARRDITVLAASENTGSVIVGGMPLSAGQFINLENYTGSINTLASELTDKIYITEVIK
jgi:hypothetical protein